MGPHLCLMSFLPRILMSSPIFDNLTHLTTSAAIPGSHITLTEIATIEPRLVDQQDVPKRITTHTLTISS